MTYLLAAIAALMGAAGVASAAAAAHAAASPLLGTMSQMLMIHAAAIIGVLALGRGSANEFWFGLAAGAMTLGIALFAGDLAARVWLGGRLFPFAAPLGGGLVIASWVAAAAVCVVAAIRG